MTAAGTCARCGRLPCHCCASEPAVPLPVGGRAGLERIPYRIGTHGSFLAALVARLSSLELEVEDVRGERRTARPLESLTARRPDDASVALLDVWASIAHVLAFYQERALNEGYLRTATEHRSLLELARLAGYRPRPGVSAGVDLALTLDPDSDTTVPAGTRFQSVPAMQDERPQIFETSDALHARTVWNELRVRRTLPHRHLIEGTLWLAGVTTQLAPGAPIAVGRSDLLRVLSVQADFEAERTAVEVEPWFREGDALPRTASNAAVRELIAALRRAFDEGDKKSIDDVVAGLRELARMLAEGRPGREIAEKLSELHETVRSQIGRSADWVRVRPVLLAIEPALAALRARYERVPVEALSERLSTPPQARGAPASFAQTFGAGGDAPLKLLVALTPRLGKELYQAWARVPQSDERALESVDALRARSAPLATRAPARPLYGDNGEVVGHAPWPLEVPIELAAHFLAAGALREGRAAMRLSAGVGSAYGEVQIAFGPDFQTVEREILADGVVHARVSLREATLLIEFTGSAFGDGRGRTIRVADAVFETGDVSIPLGPGTVHRRLVDGLFKVVPVTTPQREQPVFAVSAYVEHWRPLVDPTEILLDAEIPNAIPGGLAAIARPHAPGGAPRFVIATVQEAGTVTENRFLVPGHVTRLRLDREWAHDGALTNEDVRGYQVFVASERLATADVPIEDLVCGDEIELDGLVPGIEPGRLLIVAGVRADVPGEVRAAERVVVAGVRHGPRLLHGEPYPGDTNHTFLSLAPGLQHCYVRSSLEIRGNVVHATHGETREQILGSGDASEPLQSFPLAFEPVTHLPAATESGAESTLEVFVDGIRWDPVPLQALAGPRDRIYTTRRDARGGTSIGFGDGEHGARLPTGIENVKARLRQGLGREGNVAPGQISLLMGPALGVRGANNPLPASGGADPDGSEEIRARIPIASLALERLVGVPDYASFALDFAGIGKADAVELTDGRRSVVHVTIAGEDDVPLDEGSDLFRALYRALREHGDPHQPLALALRERLALVIEARIRIDPRRLPEEVLPAAEAALRRCFAFSARGIGRDANRSEAIAALHAVPGVALVDVQRFDALALDTLAESAADPGAAIGLRDRIAVSRAQLRDDGTIAPGGLAYLSPELPESVVLEVIPS